MSGQIQDIILNGERTLVESSDSGDGNCFKVWEVSPVFCFVRSWQRVDSVLGLFEVPMSLTIVTRYINYLLSNSVYEFGNR